MREATTSLLGYHPRFTFDQGMRETVAWYKQHEER